MVLKQEQWSLPTRNVQSNMGKLGPTRVGILLVHCTWWRSKAEPIAVVIKIDFQQIPCRWASLVLKFPSSEYIFVYGGKFRQFIVVVVSGNGWVDMDNDREVPLFIQKYFYLPCGIIRIFSTQIKIPNWISSIIQRAGELLVQVQQDVGSVFGQSRASCSFVNHGVELWTSPPHQTKADLMDWNVQEK